jgi:hypothetical protein
VAGVTAFSYIGFTNGATVTTANYLQLGLATATNPGIVGISSQTFAGSKTFQDGLVLPSSASPSTTAGALSYNTTTAGASALYIGNGSSSVSVKSFIIDHPQDKEKYLVHGCLEGPESGVYYRGKGEILDDSVVIELPHYVRDFAHELTVQLTPIYHGILNKQPLAVSEVVDNKFTVYGPKGKFYWIVYGKRSEVNVEPFKKDVVVRGDGPYKYL